MKRVVKPLVAAALLSGLLSACATYEYGYTQPYYGYYDSGGPYYYDYGPYAYGDGPYYGYAPGYYVGPPVIGFDLRYHDGYRRDRHWDGGRNWNGDHRRADNRDLRRSQQAGGAIRPAPTTSQRNPAASTPPRQQRVAPAPPARRSATTQHAQSGQRAGARADVRAEQRE